MDLDVNTTWENVVFQNPKSIDLHLNSHGSIFANTDEVYLVGGCVNERFTDRIIKFNLVQNCIFPTEFVIPGFKENEYFRFWEENTFKPLSSFGFAVNCDDDFTFGMFDARDKMHMFNSRTFKYNII